MLELLIVKSQQDKDQLFTQFDPYKDTWLVSDLTSKLEIQKKIFKARIDIEDIDNSAAKPRPLILEENAVLRANEFWLKLFNQSHPYYSVNSLEFIKSFANHWMKNQNISWAQSSETSQQLILYLSQMLPLLTHVEGQKVLGAWFSSNKEKYIQWAHWAKLCSDFWDYVKDEKIFYSLWAPALLAENEDFDYQWNRKIYFDLSSQLSLLEVELIQRISTYLDIKVIVPEYAHKDYGVWSYDILKEQIDHDRKVDLANSDQEDQKPLGNFNDFSFLDGCEVQYLRHSSMLAEVKTVVNQLRAWRESGISLRRMAVLAPDIEQYWPVLFPYLKKEGLYSQKKYLQRLSGLHMVQQWLSQVRFAAQVFEFEDLEQVFFGGDDTYNQSYGKFKSLFKNFLDKKDLEKENYMSIAMKKWQSFSKKYIADDNNVTRAQFVQWLFSAVPSSANEDLLNPVYKKIFESGYDDTVFSFKSWISFLEKIVAKIEFTVTEDVPNREGLYCDNIISGQWTGATHVLVLGLSEEFLNPKSMVGINEGDIKSIFQQTGFHLQWKTQNEKEIELQWFLQNNKLKNVVLSYPEADFSSTVLSGSKFWITNAFKKYGNQLPGVSNPSETRWDQLQKSSEQDHVQNWRTHVLRDVGEETMSNFGQGIDFHLSVSQIESYEKCPFTFAAKKLFKLYDLPDLDLDIDHMTKGKITHALFEKLTEEDPMRFSYTDNELKEVIAQIIDHKDTYVGDQVMRVVLSSYYIELAKGFLKFEKSWREQFPETQTVGREVKIEAYWDEDKKHLVEQKTGYKFVGYIDRVDKDEQGNYAIIDYKSSDAQAQNYKSWLKNDKYQLSIYAEAVENACTSLPSGSVDGAFYYVAKTLDRNKGFKVTDSSQGLYDGESYRYNSLTTEGKKSLFNDINSKVDEDIQKIKSGQFLAEPKKNESCEGCYWRSLCRAPHLI